MRRICRVDACRLPGRVERNASEAIHLNVQHTVRTETMRSLPGTHVLWQIPHRLIPAVAKGMPATHFLAHTLEPP